MTLSRLTFFVSAIAMVGCSNPQPGPDKTIAGAVLGAGWGAGAGAVVGHQVSAAGEGAGVGAGFGAVAGMMTGAGLDLGEGSQLDRKRELAALKVQNLANQKDLEEVQARLDHAAVSDAAGGGVYQVFFDDDATSLRTGSIANLEIIAESIKASPSSTIVNVVGHTDDAGTPEYNERLAEARARAVTAYLASRGISVDQIKTASAGSTKPIATNATPTGRQLNRRVDVYISR